jgi:hypothetical protein
MDGKGFDELTRRLATQRSRRSVLRGLAGGGAALVAARTGATLAAPEEKFSICHWSADLGYYELISVSGNALPAHEAHGDIIYPDFTDQATCGDCNTACGEDEICGEFGCETVFTGCFEAVLTGLDGGNGVCVDDGLLVRVNGTQVFYQPTIFCQPEVPVGPLANGDTLSLEIHDFNPPCSIEPYQLVCKDTGAVQVLDADGFCAGGICGGGWTGFGICHNPSYTVAFGG